MIRTYEEKLKANTYEDNVPCYVTDLEVCEYSDDEFFDEEFNNETSKIELNDRT